MGLIVKFYEMTKIKITGFLIFFLVALIACNKEKDVIYGLNEIETLPVNADKNKLKSPGQYLSILYANLFQTALSANGLVELSDIVEAFGDKDLIHEEIISNFMNDQGIILPSDSTMRADIDKFIEETYVRFYVRPPTELEKTYFRNYIESNENVTPELVYFSFALSNEYQFY
jgi:hypothetical protein